jgi:protein-S-isoprenylcysteine O-methyltransferase Ste14
MLKQIESMDVEKRKSSTFFFLTLLAVIFTVALTFATLELPRILAIIFFELGWIPDVNVFWEPEVVEAIMKTVRPVGYLCLAIIIILIIAGIITKNSRLSSLGAFLVFLPTFGYFAGSMFFLAGLGILRVAWIPFWENGIVDLGDIVYLPYMVITYIIALTGLDLRTPIINVPGPGHISIDVRWLLAFGINGIGLLIFFLGTMAWVYGKFMRRETVTFWVYNYSRHPQYLGYIIWSYGVMLQSSLAPFSWGGENLGVSLPWLISTLIVICIALMEEVTMIHRDKDIYLSYKKSAPFMFPVPKSLGYLVNAPIKFIYKKEQPESRLEIIVTFFVYLLILVLMSLPFLILSWVPGQMLGFWPYNVWPFINTRSI